MTIVTDLATEAIYYAEALQWRVVPCHSPIGSGCSCGKPDCKKPGKHPRLSSWQTKATADASQVVKWWQQWPEANIGLVLGPASGVFDIEFDDSEGEATAEELLSHIKTPKYRSHRSTHHLFHFGETLKPAKAVYRWRGLELRFGTDNRGALSVVPPSLHFSGSRYEWLLHPSKVGIAEAPEWLSQAMAEATAKAPEASPIALPSDGMSFTMASEKETLESHPGATEGLRHSKLLELVGRHIGTHGPSAELVSMALAWAGRCSPPMEQSEVLQVVGRLADKELGKRGESIGKASENNKGGKVDSHSNTQVRGVLGPLSELADRYRVALLGITHLAKAEAKAINRVIGSVAFVAAARSCWLVAQDSEDQKKRLFLKVKNNISEMDTGLSYSIIDGRCQWDDEAVLISADDIGGGDEDTPRDEAKKWLEAKLSDGPKPSKWILAQAKADGVAEKTLRRAQKELGVSSDRLADAWVWRLPEQELDQPPQGTFIVQ